MDRLLHPTSLGDGLILDSLFLPLHLILLPLSLDLSGERDIQICANGSKTSLRVIFLRDSHPPLDHTSTMKFLVVERGGKNSISPNLVLKGCCLQLSDSIHLSRDDLEHSGELCTFLNDFLREHYQQLLFTYDCPVRVEPRENLSFLSRRETLPVSTSCLQDEAHQVTCPWRIIIESSMCFQTTLLDGIFVALEVIFYTNKSVLDLFKYREQTACRTNCALSIQESLACQNGWLISLTCGSIIALALDLGWECQEWIEGQVLDLAKYQHYSYAAIVFTVGSYTWFCLNFLPRGSGLQRPWYKQQGVLKSLCAVHGLIGDVFVFSFSFKLCGASRPSTARLAITALNTFINIFVLVYYTVLHQMYVRYLLTIWLATFQDDWPKKPGVLLMPHFRMN